MQKKRKTKKHLYLCPNCLSPFTIQNKSLYRFIYNGTPFCKDSCMKKYKDLQRKLKNLNLK